MYFYIYLFFFLVGNLLFRFVLSRHKSSYKVRQKKVHCSGNRVECVGLFFFFLYTSPARQILHILRAGVGRVRSFFGFQLQRFSAWSEGGREHGLAFWLSFFLFRLNFFFFLFQSGVLWKTARVRYIYFLFIGGRGGNRDSFSFLCERGGDGGWMD